MPATLDSLKPGQSAIIKSIMDPALFNKMIEMGCLPGEKVTVTKRAPFGCPIAVLLPGYELSLRLEEAMTIEVEPETP